jgi:hypothetical protein
MIAEAIRIAAIYMTADNAQMNSRGGKRIRLSDHARDDLDEIWFSIAVENMPAAAIGSSTR